MPLQLIPPWAPNLHPLAIHFPIVLVFLACGADIISGVRLRARGVAALAPFLYSLGAVSAAAAYVSGRFASASVFVPGMAHGLVDDHEQWALAATVAFVLVAAARFGVHLRGGPRGRGARLVFAALGLAVVFLVQQAAERGARLVYEQGVGVIPAPVTQPVPAGDAVPSTRVTRLRGP